MEPIYSPDVTIVLFVCLALTGTLPLIMCFFKRIKKHRHHVLPMYIK